MKKFIEVVVVGLIAMLLLEAAVQYQVDRAVSPSPSPVMEAMAEEVSLVETRMGRRLKQMELWADTAVSRAASPFNRRTAHYLDNRVEGALRNTGLLLERMQRKVDYLFFHAENPMKGGWGK